MNPSASPSISLNQEIALALRYHQAGRLAEAEAIYRRVLAADPEQVDALHLLGVLAHQVGRSDIAVELIGKAVSRNAGNYAAFVNLGEAYRALGQLANAEQCYRRALAIKPDAVEAYNNLGIVLRDLGRPEEAVWACRQALAAKPDFAEAYNNLSNALQGLGMLEDAVQACRQALLIKPDFADAYSNLGSTLNELGRAEEAEQACRRALACKPDSASAYCNLGIALKGLGRLDEAEAAYRQALTLDPHFARAYSSLGNVLNDLGRLDGADRAYRQALSIKPDLYECRIKLATLLPVVVASSREGVAVQESFRRALDELEGSMGPDDWPGLGAVVGTAQPFNLAYRTGDQRPLLSRYGAIMCRARKAWLDKSAYAAPPSPIPVRDRVRMVVVSGHVSQHSVWNVLLHGLLRHLDRSRFEVILYHTALQPDAETSYVHTLVDRLVQGPTDWLRQVCDDKPDVIFYPEISMDPATFKLATLRLAPLQVACWGHPITTGLPTIDLFLSGELIEREDADDDYSEKLVRLPGTGACSLPIPVDAATPELSLESPWDHSVTHFVICQQAIKFDPLFDDLYPRIAHAHSASRFWFLRDRKYPWAAEIIEERIRRAFETSGLDPATFVHFVEWLPGDQFWGFLDMMDVFLDTPAFSGYTTAWQALHRGLPVVTLEGRFMRQRLAAGLLRRVGVPETIAADQREYVAKAAALARDIHGRKILRSRLRTAVAKADGDLRVVRAFETIVQQELYSRIERMKGMSKTDSALA